MIATTASGPVDIADNRRRRFLASGRWARRRRGLKLSYMTPAAPRRLLLVAYDATPRGTAAPIRRYRLGRVLMGVDDLLPGATAPAGTAEASTDARRRPARDGRRRA